MTRLDTLRPSLPPGRLARLIILGLGAIALVLAAACSSDDAGADDHDANDHNGDDEALEITVVSTDTLEFEPSEIRVAAGQPVRLVLDNEESVELHDWSVEHIAVHDVHEMGAEHAEHAHGDQHYDLHVAADAGETGVLEFTPGEPGEYTFLCSITGHAEAGMVGTLIVE